MSTHPAHSLRADPWLSPNHKSFKLIGDEVHGRVLCLADVRGRLSLFNDLAKELRVQAIIHTGDFGFFDHTSLERITDRTLRHLVLYSPLLSPAERDELLSDSKPSSHLRTSVSSSSKPILSQFPQLVSGAIKLSVPVYTVWGACEDVVILEKFRAGQYEVENLHILDEATSHSLDVGGVKLRLLGLGGALVPHKLFDNGDGRATIAGGQGTMWTTALQIGELVDTAQRCYDQSETRLFVSHTSPGREGILAQLALVLKADLTISAGLHFRYTSSYNEFSVEHSMEAFRSKLASGKDNFDRVWENVKSQVEAVIDDTQRILLEKCLSVIERVPSWSHAGALAEEPSWKNCWNWNLCDAAYGHLILDVRDGRISAELKSQGFNYAYRRKSSSSINNSALSIPTPSHRDDTIVSNGPARAAETIEADSDNLVNNLLRKNDDSEYGAHDEASTWTTDDHPEGAVSAALSHLIPNTSNPSPAPSASTTTHDTVDLTSPTDSTGVRTPLVNRQKRNPYTLFVNHLPPNVSDDEIRQLFGTAADGITSVKIPHQHGRQSQKLVAFVEFGDKESMETGLSNHGETLRESHPKVMLARDDSDVSKISGRGRGRGRGSSQARNTFSGLNRGRGESNKSVDTQVT